VIGLLAGGAAGVLTVWMVIRGEASSAWRGAAPMLGAMAFALPMALGGRAKPYRPDAPPAELLPR
jgi:hypothetical protein